MSRIPAIVCSFCLSALVASGQQPPSSSPRQVIGSGTTAIVVDAVVRDGKGNPMTDLRKEDFQLLEDGVEQEIGDVTSVAGTAVAPEAASPSSAPVPRRHVPSFTAIVFTRLSPEARPQAYKGALACLDSMQEGDFVGVFAVDLSLSTLHPYTNARSVVRKALQDAAVRGTWSSPDKGTLFPEPRTSAFPTAMDAQRVPDPVEVFGATERALTLLEQKQQGYGITDALAALTEGLSIAPGRKSVVMFSEGFPVPDPVLRHFRNVIASANRANVSFYAIDAAGLRTVSEQRAIGRETSYGSENVADALRTPLAVLRILAQDTGGLFMENMNDLVGAFRRVDLDRRFYYLITYTPKNTRFDGKWRRITVKVRNRDASIRSRAGYLATRAASGVFEYEEAALEALDEPRAPEQIPLRTAALVFPDGAQSQVAVLAAVDAAALRFDTDEKAHAYRTNFSIIARIRDADGRVIRKGSDPYRLSGPAQQAEQARRGSVLFFRQPALEPGSYTLEVAVHDALARRIGVRRMPVLVPQPSSGGPQVSTLALIQRVERVPPNERQAGNPLYAGELLVYPNLGEPVRKSQQNTLPLYFVIVGGTGGVLKAELEIVKDGQSLMRAPVNLAAPDASGRSANIAQLPIGTLAAGKYSLKLTVSQGDKREVREAEFALVQ
jgi:VWFA-related protein